jgi:hypothetical protein
MTAVEFQFGISAVWLLGLFVILIHSEIRRRRRISALRALLAAGVAQVAGPFVPPSPYLLDAVAAAIAQAAGHNWHAPTMMPGYRAEFRRQAAAAIDAFRAAA